MRKALYFPKQRNLGKSDTVLHFCEFFNVWVGNIWKECHLLLPSVGFNMLFWLKGLKNV